MTARGLAVVLAAAVLAACSTPGVPEDTISGWDQIGSLDFTYNSCTDDRVDPQVAFCTRQYIVGTEADAQTVAEFVRENGFEIVDIEAPRQGFYDITAIDASRDDRCLAASTLPAEDLTILVRQPFQEGGANVCRSLIG